MAQQAVVHDQAGSRFVTTVEGEEAFLKYRRSGTVVDFFHTFVPEQHRGRGLAEQVCRAAFEYAKAEGLTVIPSCPYISGAYLKRHPEYVPLTKAAPSSGPAGSA